MKVAKNGRIRRYRLEYIDGETVEVEAEECHGVLSFLRPAAQEWDNKFISMAQLKSFTEMNS
jgi:hypothetical protein